MVSMTVDARSEPYRTAGIVISAFTDNVMDPAGSPIATATGLPAGSMTDKVCLANLLAVSIV